MFQGFRFLIIDAGWRATCCRGRFGERLSELQCGKVDYNGQHVMLIHHCYDPSIRTRKCTLHLTAFDVIFEHMTLASQTQRFDSLTVSERQRHKSNGFNPDRSNFLQPTSIIVFTKAQIYSFRFVGNVMGHLITDILILRLDGDTKPPHRSSTHESNNYSIVN